MLIDVILITFFAGVLFLLFKIKQASSFISSVSLLAIVLISKIFSQSLQNVLYNNGFAKDGYPEIIFHLLIIIIGWGLFYAILSNIRAETFEKNGFVYAIIPSVLFFFSTGIITCFVLSNINMGLSNSSLFCQKCNVVLASSTSTAQILVPKKLDASITLSGTDAIREELSASEDDLLNEINLARKNAGLWPLSGEKALKLLAINYANEIVRSLRFSHTDGNNNSPSERARLHGIHYNFLGENLAIAPTSSEAHIALMNSVTHRENILSNKFYKVGIAVFRLENNSIIVVEEFSD